MEFDHRVSKTKFLSADLCRKCDQVLRGHTSTVRCIQSAGYKTVVSGSRDTTLRVWDLQKGVSTKVLVGHSSSVRCLAVHGDIVVSGSYDYTAMVYFPHKTLGILR